MALHVECACDDLGRQSVLAVIYEDVCHQVAHTTSVSTRHGAPPNEDIRYIHCLVLADGSGVTVEHRLVRDVASPWRSAGWSLVSIQ